MNKVEICGINTATLPTLSGKEMQELMIKLKNGDEKAKDKFVYSNLKLVLSVVKRFSNKTNDADDLFQVGTLGLIKAVDNFDINVGVKFSTYAVPMIIGEIRRFLRDNSPLRISRSLRDIAYKALQAKTKLSKDNKEPNIEEIAKEINEPLQDVATALEALVDTISLDEPVYNDGEDSCLVMDQIGDLKSGENKSIDKIDLQKAMNNLSSREKDILNLRYFIGKTQVEISNEVGISQAQVSRLEKTALKTLRKSIK
jgi:RNA polymerase sporulation-specific sigma factor